MHRRPCSARAFAGRRRSPRCPCNIPPPDSSSSRKDTSTLDTLDDQGIADVVTRVRSRLWRFIRRRVADPSDAEDILQDVFSKLVEANRLLMPIDHLTGWLFQVARNRIVDVFRRRKTAAPLDDDLRAIEDLLPSPDAGPEALYAHGVLVDEIALAIEELPEEQRAVFVAHELDGESFSDISARTGVNLNTLLSRKHYAVRRLRQRLQGIYDELGKG